MSRWGLWWYEVVLKKFVFLPTTVRIYANIVFIVYAVVFRLCSPEKSVLSMKLTAKKARYIVRHKKKGKSSDTIGKDMQISIRRVNQVWWEYKETGKEPVIGKELGRPKKTITPDESEIIKTAFNRFKYRARMPEPVIDGIYNFHILIFHSIRAGA